MLLKGSINIRHLELHDSLLDVNGFQKSGKTRREDHVHGIDIVQARKCRVGLLWPKVAEKCGSYWTHALDIAALFTP